MGDRAAGRRPGGAYRATAAASAKTAATAKGCSMSAVETGAPVAGDERRALQEPRPGEHDPGHREHGRTAP